MGFVALIFMLIVVFLLISFEMHMRKNNLHNEKLLERLDRILELLDEKRK